MTRVALATCLHPRIARLFVFVARDLHRVVTFLCALLASRARDYPHRHPPVVERLNRRSGEIGIAVSRLLGSSCERLSCRYEIDILFSMLHLGDFSR